MNKVIPDDPTKLHSHFTVSQLTGDNLVRDHNTAFIGRCGEEDKEDGLHLITFSNIVHAADPRRTWSSGPVLVLRFVDVEIAVKEKEE